MIQTAARTDDWVLRVKFDATPYFEAADEAQLRALADHDWKGKEPVTDIVTALAPHTPRLRHLLDYAKKKGIRFVCIVNRADAEEWIKENRPKWAPRFTSHVGVRHPAGDES